MKRMVMGIATAVAILAGAVIPATPASANELNSRCEGTTVKRCVALEFTDNYYSVRAIGSLQDNTSGDDTVAVVVHLWNFDGDNWRRIETSRPSLANNYALTATGYHLCRTGRGTWLADLEWSYKGQPVERLFSAPISHDGAGEC
jgi:hypothetical protein